MLFSTTVVENCNQICGIVVMIKYNNFKKNQITRPRMHLWPDARFISP